MWTLKHLEGLKKDGKIREFKLDLPKQKPSLGRLIAKHFKKRSKEKDWIGWNLWIWSQEHQFKLYEEYRFDETEVRKFRFDYCFPEIKIAIEYEGIFSEKSGHTTVTGYTKDAIKYNLAQAQGWRVIRLTAINYKTLLEEINKLI